MIDYTPIIQAIIALAGVLITAFLIPWIKSKYTNEQIGKAQYWVNVAVRAAEQTLKVVDETGEKRKKFVEDFLASKNLKIDTASIGNMIEAAVIELNNELKAVA